MRLKGGIHLDPKLKEALSALAETQPFRELIPVPVKSARANSAALDIFSRPERKEVLADFTGSDHRFAVVRLGDRVVLHGKYGEEAIIFNERKHSVGRVPFSILGWVPPEADLQFETFTSRESYKGNPLLGYFLSWQVGTRILVCSWENRKMCRGIGINLSTGETGRFEICSRNCVVDS